MLKGTAREQKIIQRKIKPCHGVSTFASVLCDSVYITYPLVLCWMSVLTEGLKTCNTKVKAHLFGSNENINPYFQLIKNTSQKLLRKYDVQWKCRVQETS